MHILKSLYLNNTQHTQKKSLVFKYHTWWYLWGRTFRSFLSTLAYIVFVCIQNKVVQLIESTKSLCPFPKFTLISLPGFVRKEFFDVVRSTFGRLMSTQSHRRTILYSNWVSAKTQIICVWMGIMCFFLYRSLFFVYGKETLYILSEEIRTQSEKHLLWGLSAMYVQNYIRSAGAFV